MPALVEKASKLSFLERSNSEYGLHRLSGRKRATFLTSCFLLKNLSPLVKTKNFVIITNEKEMQKFIFVFRPNVVIMRRSRNNK